MSVTSVPTQNAQHDSEGWAREASRAFLESAPDAVVIIDSAGTVILVNAQTEAIFGYPRSQLVGQPVEILLPERFRDAHIAHRAGYVPEPRIRAMGAGLDLYGKRADGSEFPIDISLAPLVTEEGRLMAATVRDVTEQKRLESARHEFIHHAAHELRTPLATLAALGETLALRMGEMSPENIAEALGALKRQGERASTLVANLLDLTQLEGGHADLRLAEVALRPTIERVLEAAPAPEGKTVTTEVADDVVLIADQMLLERVLTNLLTNAYRYGGSQVRIRARSAGSEVVVEVADDGDGVAADLLPTVFDPFVRGKTAGAVGGSGVGLALCRRIIQTLHGSIDYDGTRDGACFTIRMPDSR